MRLLLRFEDKKIVHCEGLQHIEILDKIRLCLKQRCEFELAELGHFCRTRTRKIKFLEFELEKKNNRVQVH